MKFTKHTRGLNRRISFLRQMLGLEIEESLQKELNNIRLRKALCAVLGCIDEAKSQQNMVTRGFTAVDIPADVEEKIQDALDTAWYEEEGLDSV